jgi:purine-binding chemotaxis protein CheW
MSTDLLPSETKPMASSVSEGKYLTFNLADETYGVGVLEVREIIRHQVITPVAKVPHYIRGIINLRGKIIPVIDLGLRFGLGAIEETNQTCIIVVQYNTKNQPDRLAGLMVKGVREVTQISSDDIEQAPDFGDGVSLQFVKGMAKGKSGVCTLLHIQSIIGPSTLESTF